MIQNEKTKLMLERFLSYIQEKKLVIAGEKVLLAVSGGVDSMVMAYLFQGAGYEIALAHINHHLRGEESGSDAALVKSYAEKYGLPFFQLDIDPKEFIGCSIQDKARNIRYTWLNQISELHEFGKIATAHHKDDAIETFFINLMRGSGLDCLGGIDATNGKIIRPLLFASKKEIEDFCQKNAIPFREDASNMSDKYLRNRLRNNVLPQFYNADSRAYSGIQTSIENLEESHILLEFLVQQTSKSLVTVSSEYIMVDLKVLGHSVPGRQLLFQIIKKYGFNMEQVSNILEGQSSTGNHFQTATHESIVDRGNLIIRPKGKTFHFDTEITIHQLPFEYSLQDRKIVITEIVKSSIIPRDNQDIIFINADQLLDGLILRGVRPGDIFQPSGMKGKSQKLKDYFINQKVHLFDKEKLVVLTHKNDIIAIPGYRKSEKVAITQDTGKIWKIELKNLSNIDSIPG